MTVNQSDFFNPGGGTGGTGIEGTPVDPASSQGSLIDLASEVAGILSEGSIDDSIARDAEVDAAIAAALGAFKAVKAIELAVSETGAGSPVVVTSTADIPINAIVFDTKVSVSSAFASDISLIVGTSSLSLDSFLESGVVLLSDVGVTSRPQYTLVSTAGPVTVTLAAAPSGSGQATILVIYVVPEG
jgi:hypothetical protein